MHEENRGLPRIAGFLGLAPPRGCCSNCLDAVKAISIAFHPAADYVRDLIRADRRRQIEGRLDALLREGIDSGAPIEVIPGYWESKKRTLAGRVARRDNLGPDDA